MLRLTRSDYSSMSPTHAAVHQKRKKTHFSKSDFLLQELVASTPEPRNWRANIISVLGIRFNLKMFVSL